jgi:hypothetical protein
MTAVPLKAPQVRPDSGSGAERERVWRPGGATTALLVTALLYGAGQFQGWRVRLGWDESIYLSQVSRLAPAAFFSAPRARGITWLAAPLELVSSSTTDLRIYLSVLSAVALFLAFRIWFTVVTPFAAVLAAVGFASLWITRFYGAQLMPNLWVAFGVLAAIGGFLRLAADRRDRVGLAALPLGLVVAALMRPTDAAWVTVVLLGFAVVVPRWRRNLRLALLTVVGSVLGAAPWVIESYQRFGGVSARLGQASAIQGGLGWHPSALLQHWQTLDGPLLCRPCVPPSTPPASTFWWLAIPVAVLISLALAGSRRRLPDDRLPDDRLPQDRLPHEGLPSALLPVVAGLAVAVPYLFLVDYSAPRFLLPAIAALSLPVGVALEQVLVAVRQVGARKGSYLLGALLVLGLGIQVVSQQGVLSSQVTLTARATAVYPLLAAELDRLGVEPPCVVSGVRSPQIAFYTRCQSRNVGGHDGSITLPALKAMARREPVVLVLEPGRKVPRYARSWAHHPLSVADLGPVWTAYLPPAG